MTGVGGSYAGIDLGRVSTSWHIAGTGDFNNDAKSDILWHSDLGDTYLWEMTGVGATYAGVDLGRLRPVGTSRVPVTSMETTRATSSGATMMATSFSGR